MRFLALPAALLIVATGHGQWKGYSYSSGTFKSFVADSFAQVGKKDPGAFSRWMDQAGKDKGWKDWKGWQPWLRAQKRIVDSSTRGDGARLVLGAEIHKRIKQIIPRFNLDRGFEFHYTVSRGERQCYLQAVLIAALLQEAGQEAGVAMVSKNHHGNATNNGHAVCLLRIAPNRSVIVDASEPEPFPMQQGLFVRNSKTRSYVYVTPHFAADSTITRFSTVKDNKGVPIEPLDTAFIHSQFEFYRGERAQGGLVLTPVSNKGLAEAEKHLRKSAALCPRNTLAVFFLGRVLERQKKMGEAHTVYVRAARLYNEAGWLPDGPRAALARMAKE